jgi:hypothetical protein
MIAAKEETRQKSTVLTEEKLDDIHTMIQTSPSKSLKQLAQTTSVATTSARKATQLSQLRLHTKIVVHVLKEQDPAARIHFFKLVSSVLCSMEKIHTYCFYWIRPSVP